MQYKQFKKRVLIETGVIAGIIAVLSGGIFFLMSVNDSYTESLNAGQTKIDGIDRDMTQLKVKYNFIRQNDVLYKEVQRKEAEGQLTINRQLVLDKFNQFRTKYGLANLRLTVTTPQEVKDPKYKRKTSAVSSSEVDAVLDVLSDENIYALLLAMQQDLPGVSVITKLTMAKDKTVGAEVLRAITEKSTFPLIKAEIQFIWYSINPVVVPDPAAANKLLPGQVPGLPGQPPVPPGGSLPRRPPP